MTTFTAMLICMPAVAEEQSDTEMDEGLSLMEQGARMFMRGIITEIEPTLDIWQEELREIGPAFAEFAKTVGPAFGELLERVDDLSHYEAPEILPNGDIIIRRSPDAPVWNEDPETPEIEL